MIYRTNCKMYTEVNVGNPGDVPCCSLTGKLEPDCSKCERPNITNADRIRAMTDEEMAAWLCEISGWLSLYEDKEHPILKWLQQEAIHEK